MAVCVYPVGETTEPNMSFLSGNKCPVPEPTKMATSVDELDAAK